MINVLTDDEIKELFESTPKCHWPELHIIRGRIANTPEFMRRYFIELGRKQK